MITLELVQGTPEWNTARARHFQNGVCPCCTRTFPNLAAHMKTKHPDFGAPMMFKTLREMFGLTQRAVADEIGVPSQYVSMFEREKPVPALAAERLSAWVETNAKAKA